MLEWVKSRFWKGSKLPDSLRDFVVAYHNQGLSLEKDLKQAGDPTFVASVTLVQNKDGSYYSAAVWTQGVRTLLPKTDLLVFVHEYQSVVAIAHWDKVFQEFGHFMEKKDLSPERFLVKRWPPFGGVQRLGNVLIPEGADPKTTFRWN